MSNNKNKIQLDEYTVFPAHNKILKGDTETKVEPKIMQVLHFLIQHQGQVFSRQDIAAALWPDSVVSLEVITRAIFELRKVLEDSAQHPKYIETIARKGYCFIYHVEESQPDNHPETGLSPEKPAVADDKTSSSNWVALITITLGLIVAVITFKWFQTDSDTSGQASITLKSTALTSGINNARMPALSPDEKLMLFVEDLPGKSTNQLVLMDISSRKKQILATEARFANPVWNNSGEGWYFTRCYPRGCQIYYQSGIDSEPSHLWDTSSVINALDLHPNGQLLVMSYRESGNNLTALLNIVTKTLQPLALNDRSNTHPKFHPSGKGFYYISRPQNEAPGLRFYDINTNISETINDDFYAIFNFAFHSHDEIWVAGKTQNRMGLWLLNTGTGKMLEIAHNFSGQFQSDISSSVSGNTILFKNANRNIDIGFRGVPLIGAGWNSSGIDIRASYSRKHNALYYVSNQTGAHEIWKYSDAGAEKLTSLNANSLSQPVLSLSQDKLFFLNKFVDKFVLVSIELSTNKSEEVAALPKNTELIGFENALTVFLTLEEDGQYVLGKLNLSNGELTKVVVNAGGYAKQTGERLHYISLPSFKLMQRKADGSVDVVIDLASLSAVMAPHTYYLDDSAFYYIANVDKGYIVRKLSLDDQTIEDLYPLPETAVVTHLEGGQTPIVVFDYLVSDSSEIVMLERIQ